jgi:phage gp29-like protein
MKIDELRKTIAKLEANLVAASNKATALQTERRKIAFGAFNGDGQARSVLDELNTNSAIANLENENARAALDEGRRQLALAEVEWEAAAPRRLEAARQAKELVEQAETFGGVMADGLDRLCGGFAEFDACLDRNWSVLDTQSPPVGCDFLLTPVRSRAGCIKPDWAST